MNAWLSCGNNLSVQRRDRARPEPGEWKVKYISESTVGSDATHTQTIYLVIKPWSLGEL